MSGECGYRCPEYTRSSFTGNNISTIEVAKLASATLSKLNSMMKQMGDWRDERLVLESNMFRLKSELKKLGKSPDVALGPDPLVVHQRSEINRLELTVDRLEDEVRSLREALLEADQAITCSGARKLKEKMAKVREEGVEARRKLEDEIGHLRVRVEEAEGESSCSSLGRLRLKLREILKVDKKMERMIADVALRSCGTMIELSNELTKIKEMLDDSRLENIRLDAERQRLEVALESGAANLKLESSAHLEIIERLGFRVAELEGRIKELEDALDENRKELEDQESVATSLRNEMIGAKTAYKIQSEELAGLRDSRVELEALKEAVKRREDTVADLERRLKLSVSSSRDVERLGDELKRVKTELFNLEIERDELLDEIDKMGDIVSRRNEHIVKILEEAEARRFEIDGVRNRLSVALADNEVLRLRCQELENELAKSSQTGKASGDAPLVKRIKELEEELAGIKRVSYSVEDSNPEVKTCRYRVHAVQTSNVKLEENQRLVARLVERLSKLRTENSTLKDELDYLRAKNLEKPKVDAKIETETSELRNQETQADDDSEEKLESSLRKVTLERDALKIEYKKLTSKNRGLNIELERSKSKIEELTLANESLVENIRGFEGLREKLETMEEELGRAFEEANALKGVKASIEENLRVENEELKMSLNEEKVARSEVELSLEKLRVELRNDRSELGKEIKNEKNEKSSGEEKLGETEGLVMNCGDYVRADRELKYYIHLQSLAVKRVVDFISYVDAVEAENPRPAMAKFLEPTASNLMALNFDENITATFRMSHKLSAKIFAAEIEVQKLEALKKERNDLRVERDCLSHGVERLSTMLQKLGQEISIPRNAQPPQNDSSNFETSGENEAWHLAGWKNENFNSKYEEEDEEDLSGMNGRIFALKMKIKLKQEEAAEKLIEMRETMRQERIRLMEIADRANLPHSEELAAEDS